MSQKKTNELKNYLRQYEKGDLKFERLYDHKIVNWSGKTFNGSYYTDYIANWLLENKDKFNSVLDGMTSQRENYFVKGHDGVVFKQTNREEEIFAKSLLGLNLFDLGRIIGYQLPLKAKRSDEYGKIDLVSVNKDEPVAYLIELKMVDKGETLLRAALELETYYQILNEKTFREYLVKKIGPESRYEGHELSKIDTDTIPIRKAILFAMNEPVGYNNQSHYPKELRRENQEDYQSVFKLLDKNNLDIDIFATFKRWHVQKWEQQWT